MKKILVTVVLGVAVAAAGQSTPPAGQQQPQGQPAQGQPAAPASQAPVIKDPAEYNAYVGAVQQTDANAKISGLEAFVTQYPNSVMKNQALEILMGTYQQTGNQQKTIDTATKLVNSDPNNVTPMALLAYIDRLKAQGGDANAAQDLVDAEKYGQMGLDKLPSYKCEGTPEADCQKKKDQMAQIFKAAVGVAALQKKDYAKAVENLKPVADASPTDFSVVYPLALAYLTTADPKTPPTPDNAVNGIWYAARASAIAPAQAQAQLEKYARSQYIKFHGGDDGWTDVLAKAKASPAPPADLTTLIKPAPTPAEQAHKMVTDTPPDKMDFATWEFVLTNGSQADQDTVWNAIKGKAVQMNGTVISATSTEFKIAGSSDDIDAKKADITLSFEDKVPVRLMPKEGASLDFQGTPVSYTPNPFMMNMEKGALLKAAAPAAKKPPVHHKPATHQ
jgi:tetratricopeptide (TPR) repeat protein